MKKLYYFLILLIFQLDAGAQTSFPYLQDFEASNGGWHQAYDSAAPIQQIDSVWYWGKPTNSVVSTAGSGDKAFYTTFKNHPEGFSGDPYIVSPVFNLPTDQYYNIAVSIKIAMKFEGDLNGAFLGYKTQDGYWEILGRIGDPAGWLYNHWFEGYIPGWANYDLPWQTLEIKLPTNPSMQTLQFGLSFHYRNDGTPDFDYGVAFDDFSMKIEPLITEADSLALVALYHKTNGPGWVRKQNWLTGEVHTWEGLSIYQGKMSINLSESGLVGTIPDEIYSIKSLDLLNLSYNSIFGSLSPSIKNAENLTTLMLGFNNLTGKVPKEIAELSKLENLQLNNNNLSGSLPEWPNPHPYFYMNVAHNNLTGNIPYLGPASHYSQDFSFNRFTSISRFTEDIYGLYWRINNNDLSFEDIEPILSKAGRADAEYYSPQSDVGKLITYVQDAGSTLTLTASAGGNTPNTRYQWFKEGVAITPEQRSPELKLQNLPGGFSSYYQRRVTNFKVPYLVLWTKTNYVKVRLPNERVVYRVNNGGTIVTDIPMNWTSASPYDVSSTPSRSEGNCNWPDPTNITGAPNCIFGSFTTSSGSELNYKFPLENGKYRVNLYFAAKKAPTTVAGKTFNVMLENRNVLTNFDIFATAGFDAVIRSFVVDVFDGNIDLRFIKALGNPQINGIEITSIASTSSSLVGSNDQKSTAFPNPLAHENVTVLIPDGKVGKITIEVADKHGRIIYTKVVTKGAEVASFELALGNKNLLPGIYFIKVAGEELQPEIIRLIKE